MNQTELEWKYINYAVELRKIKDGRCGHNLWFWIIRTYLNLSLRLRLARLNSDFEENLITRDQYDNWATIIKNSI